MQAICLAYKGKLRCWEVEGCFCQEVLRENCAKCPIYKNTFLQSNLPKVLAVDDNPSILKLLRIVLEEKFEVLEACNGKEALDLIKQNKPHILIVDIMMPVMNGLELIERVREEYSSLELPIVILTVRGDTKELLKEHNLEVEGVLTKPFVPLELISILDKFIR